MAPTIEKLKNKWQDRVMFLKFDMSQERYREFAMRMNVRGAPTLRFIESTGRMQREIIGVPKEEEILAELEKLVKSGNP